MSKNPIFYRSAVDLTAAIRNREMSVEEVMRIFLDRIAAVNPMVNAICALRPEDELLAEARVVDDILDRGMPVGPLHGLPLAVKDLALTKGIPTTYGSPIYKNFIPDQDQLFVERLKKAGAIIIGKTNTPEFGAGSHTFNPVYGITRNPYDLSKTAGGSSGGAAAALASGMLPMADGSDLGGSLRNPAGFCNVAGFRPSPGRVPVWPSKNAWNTLSVEGPLARTVQDLALKLSVIAGPDDRAPLAIDTPGSEFNQPLEKDLKGVSIALTTDFGEFPVQKAVVGRFEKALNAFVSLGCVVHQDHPRVGDVFEAFQTLRALDFTAWRHDYEKNGSLMKESVVWNIRKGLDLNASEITRAQESRTQFYHRVRRFLRNYDFLVLPTTQVTPFPVEQEWVKEIDGVSMPTYIDWMAMNCVVTMTGLPALSIPCGFTADGLPVGLQIVGRHHRDFEVLQLAHAFEQETRYHEHRPQALSETLSISGRRA